MARSTYSFLLEKDSGMLFPPGMMGTIFPTSGMQHSCFHTSGARCRSRGFLVRMATPIRMPRNRNCSMCSSRQEDGLKRNLGTHGRQDRGQTGDRQRTDRGQTEDRQRTDRGRVEEEPGDTRPSGQRTDRGQTGDGLKRNLGTHGRQDRGQTGERQQTDRQRQTDRQFLCQVSSPVPVVAHLGRGVGGGDEQLHHARLQLLQTTEQRVTGRSGDAGGTGVAAAVPGTSP
ncbi:hypothetical protein EYF80_053658 [Liparis tanakae]|uniref:Uncharacterized protein n=1 Tax=Liparis tanakae TaxID=230148 RepID=A0A4Z2F5Y7_9TELE|nr:hypothetical protein EYF80_053658 [Liparis tanakae]